MTKKKFSRVYVLANGARLAHTVAKECNVKTVNFVYVNNEKTIKHCDNALFLLDDSFLKHKKYLIIKKTLNSLKKATILNIKEFQDKISYEF
jgi:hypothetical protein